MRRDAPGDARLVGERLVEGRLIGERLVAAGLATPEDVEAGLRAQRTARGSLAYHLHRLGRVGAPEITRFLEEEIAAGRLEAPSPDADVLAVLPARLAHLYAALPLALEGRRLLLGIPPHHGDAVTAIGDATGLLVEPSLLPQHVLRDAVERAYLGAASTLVVPPCGLPVLVVDDGESVRPLAPELRDDALAPETWLRSALAEAINARTRSLEVPSGEARRLPGGDARALVELVERLAALPPRGPRTTTGRFLADVRGRRLVVACTRDGWEEPRLRLRLSEPRHGSDDAEDLLADAPVAKDAIESGVESGHGLVLIVAPSGGGGRRLVRLIAPLLAAARPGSAWLGSVPPPAGEWGSSASVSGDADLARALQDAADAGAGLVVVEELAGPRSAELLVVVEELAGPRSAERALLAAGRAFVLAGLVAADAEAAFAWLVRQGLDGAVRAGLVTGAVSVLAPDAACPSCAHEVDWSPLRALLLERHAAALPPGPLVENAGCERCDGPTARRAPPVLAWTAGGAPEAVAGLDDEKAARRIARASGVRGVLEIALERCVPGGGAEAGSLRALLREGLAEPAGPDAGRGATS